MFFIISATTLLWGANTKLCVKNVILSRVTTLETQDFEEILNIWNKIRNLGYKKLRKLLKEIFENKNTTTFIVRENGKIVSFAAMDYQNNPKLFIDTPMAGTPSYNFSIDGTDPNFGGQGHYSKINMERLRSVAAKARAVGPHQKTHFHTVTQNPRVYSTTIKTLEALKAEGLIADYKLRMKLERKGYFAGENLAKETQTTNNTEAQRIFSEINIEQGDAFIFAWEIIPAT